ncbi:MAG: glutamate-5-semialdehyde dehydrogenase [Actinomycetota bacterium]|jgi:glutamate-5-semialdehyde dehydrogenase|nr:glutamate-5-semialdehyde dehydrogenase [Actinomycetota bacterium]
MASVTEICERAASAAPKVAILTSSTKDAALEAMATALESSATELQAANQIDVEAARAQGTSETLIDRLTLTGSRLAAMAEGLRAVAAQPDPIGEVAEGWTRPNGLSIEKVRVPLGVVAVIYEARPNVTADVAGLCLKSGNACVLRGSSIAVNSNKAIVGVLTRAATSAGIPEGALMLIEDTERSSALELMQAKGLVDLLVPRGGKALISSIEEHAKVPFIIDGDGNCHVYVDRSADLDRATAIIVNAKTQRPSVCNAAETLLVHEEIADKWLPSALDALGDEGVTIRGDDRVRQLWANAEAATDADWATEYLDLTLAVRVVGSLDDAIDHVNRFGTSNADAIVTEDLSAARRFVHEVDSGSVFVNASTRFSDGGEFGYGAEIGISTQKLHARGPMGLKELTTLKYVVWGDGQVRE